MMLQALMAYAERKIVEDPSFSDPDFEPVNLHWLIPIDGTGHLSGDPISLTLHEGNKKVNHKARRPATSVNEISVRSLAKAKSYFLCDTLGRVLNMADDGGESDDSLTQARHSYFKSLLQEAAEVSPAVAQAILSFLNSETEIGHCRSKLIAFRAKTNENCAFQVLGKNVLEDQGFIAFWRKRRAGALIANAGEHQICLVTGQLIQTVGTTEKIKGVGGQDTNLISANEKAFQSFGLEQARNSPISARAESLTRAALNDLIAKAFRTGEKHPIYHLHWTREPASNDVFSILESADEASVRRILSAPQSGHSPTEKDPNSYYAMSISGNGGRIIVREWLESTVTEVTKNVSEWFRDLEIVEKDGDQLKHSFRLWGLLATLVPTKNGKPDFDTLPPQLFTQLIYSALRGERHALPETVLSRAVLRQRIETRKPEDKFIPRMNPGRLALIKVCLLRSPNRKPHHTMTAKLDPDSIDIPYLAGRLFAVIGRLQLIALGKLGASLADRTYGGVATRPATTLGPVFTKIPAYIKKANSRFPGAGTNRQKEIEDLCSRIDLVNKSEGRRGFPATFDLEEQGRFALGYYCQLAQYRADKRELEIEETAELGSSETI